MLYYFFMYLRICFPVNVSEVMNSLHRACQVTSGDTSAALLKRFGMSESQLFRNNPTLQDVQKLAQDSFLCIVPNWQEVYGASGQRICAAAA